MREKTSVNKILFILPNFSFGGAEKVTLTILSLLDRKKFQPILFLVNNAGEYQRDLPDDVIKVFALEANQKLSKINLFLVINKLLKVARSCDLVIGALELTSTYLAVLVSKVLGLPVIGWVHTNLKSFPVANKFRHRVLIRLCYSHLDGIITVSESAKLELAGLLPKLKERIKVIYNPILPPKKISKIDAIPTRDIPFILAVGRLAPEKGFDILLAAYKRILKLGLDKQLIIIGEGAERLRLEGIISDFGLQDKVRLMGYVSDVNAWMKRAELLVISSRVEGFGLVALEALYEGLPVVAFDCPGGLNEIFENGTFGVLVPPENPEALAESVFNVLTNSGLAKYLRDKGPLRAQDFLPEKIIPKFEAFFQANCKNIYT